MGLGDFGGKEIQDITGPVRVFELSASPIAKAKGDAVCLKSKAGRTVPVTASFLSKAGLAVPQRRADNLND
jgi:hypothetical protein